MNEWMCFQNGRGTCQLRSPWHAFAGFGRAVAASGCMQAGGQTLVPVGPENLVRVCQQHEQPVSNPRALAHEIISRSEFFVLMEAVIQLAAFGWKQQLSPHSR